LIYTVTIGKRNKSYAEKSAITMKWVYTLYRTTKNIECKKIRFTFFMSFQLNSRAVSWFLWQKLSSENKESTKPKSSKNNKIDPAKKNFYKKKL